MKIFLAYDRENAANASYWEYYFKSCGIWAEKKSYKEKLKIPTGFKGVALVSPKRLEEYSGGNISDFVYRMPDGNQSISLGSYMPATVIGHTVAVGSTCLPARTKVHVTIKPEPGNLAEAKLKELVRLDDGQLRKARVNLLSGTDSDKPKKKKRAVKGVVTKGLQSGGEASAWSDIDKCAQIKAIKPVRVQAHAAERDDDVNVAPGKYYRSLIESISGEDREYQRLTQLFRIYTGKQLWKACWLYEEFAKGDIRRWDKEIVQICEKGLDSIRDNIRETENEHIRYMEFYFRYILCGAGYRALSRRHEKCRELLEDFRPVLERYGSNAMFQHLAGRICELSSVANKQAVFYYQKAAKQQSCSDFFYDLGHSFEKVYGDDKMALRFYREACELDSENYKALYKLASGHELRREWIEAYCLYSRIEKKLGALIEQNYRCGSAVSVQEIEYPYKAYKRLSHICRRIFGWGDEEDGYVKKRSEITEKYLSAKSFGKLAALMGEPGKGGEIAEEIKNKFTGKCYQ